LDLQNGIDIIDKVTSDLYIQSSILLYNIVYGVSQQHSAFKVFT